jgi:hypothetical protein
VPLTAGILPCSAPRASTCSRELGHQGRREADRHAAPRCKGRSRRSRTGRDCRLHRPDMAERMQRKMRWLLRCFEGHEADVMRLADFLKRPAHTGVACQPSAAVRRADGGSGRVPAASTPSVRPFRKCGHGQEGSRRHLGPLRSCELSGAPPSTWFPERSL